ncbi:MAG: inositol phosphorylceramide synthase, partial [Chitinophagaceae bacterium]|nr:inositol phosphorylceramide synthase [Chitinophagaceae bacterium]
MTGSFNQSKKRLFAVRDLLITSLVSCAYLLLSYWLIGYQQDQLTLVLLFNICYYLSFISRKFILGFSIFIVFWIIFDFMKAFPNYNYQEVHIQSLYEVEKKWLGIQEAGKLITPNEYWTIHSNRFLDVLAGFFYLSWVPVPLGFAAFLFFRNRTWFLEFSLTFLFVNILGFIIYYVYPAAPPWYVQQYGFDFIAGTPGNTAGLQRFDAYFGVSVFKSLYEKSSNVFAAMPSLHSAYPLIVLYFGCRFRFTWINLLFAIIMFGIWFAAVYTSHHYVLDVLAGITCAIIGIIIFAKLSRQKTVSKWIETYARYISSLT